MTLPGGRVSKGMLHGYFPSKRALLLALLAEDAGLVDSLIGGLTDGPVNGADRLRRRHGIARHPWVMTNHGIQAQ
jgi:AcrR family transcriptional regulator